MSLDHKIIWNQMNTSDMDQAIQFYEDLFGWTTREAERDIYVHFYQGDQTVAGVMPLQGPPGTPCHWAVHLGTDDIDGLTQRAVAEGGQLLTPVMDIPSTGRLCAMKDSGDAMLMAFQPAEPKRDSWGPQNKPGHFCWVELMCHDVPKSLDYYQKVVGWDVIDAQMPSVAYHMFAPPGGDMSQSVGGVMKAPMAEIPAHWLPYVFVESVDASAEKAKGLGAELCVPPTDIPGQGRFSVFIDPQQAVIAVFEALAQA